MKRLIGLVLFIALLLGAIGHTDAARPTVPAVPTPCTSSDTCPTPTPAPTPCTSRC